MRVVLSWSGERSRTVARALWGWLPRVLYFADPWMSDADIHAGQRWAGEVASALEEAGFGILCITRESVNAPWLLFEAGALSRPSSGTPVVPLLIDVPVSCISGGPLGQFQAARLDRQGCHDLVVSINIRFGSLIDRAELDRLFDERWPELAARFGGSPPEPRLEPPQRPRKLDTPVAEPVGAIRLPGIPSSIPPDVLRRAATQARDDTSLRALASDAGITPMGLHAFILGGKPQRRTLQKLSAWYVSQSGD